MKYLHYNGKRYVFNESYVAKAKEISVEFLEAILKQSLDNHLEAFYPVFLMVLANTSQNALNSIGEQGIKSLFTRSVRVEEESKDDSEH